MAACPLTADLLDLETAQLSTVIVFKVPKFISYTVNLDVKQALPPLVGRSRFASCWHVFVSYFPPNQASV